jgi:N-methylhydantoinase A
MTRVLIPPAPGVLCADGLLAADLKAEFSRTLPKAGPVAMDAVEPILVELERQADAWLSVEGVAEQDRGRRRVALMRYHGQGGEIAVAWGETRAAVETGFVAAHQALYGFTLESAIELVTVRIEATGRMPEPRHQSLARGSGAKPGGRRAVHLADGVAQVPVYDRATLGAGDRLAGPAIITQLDATTLVAPGWSAEVHISGALLLTFRPS